jgi:hypothetical protein
MSARLRAEPPVGSGRYWSVRGKAVIDRLSRLPCGLLLYERTHSGIQVLIRRLFAIGVEPDVMVSFDVESSIPLHPGILNCQTASVF